MNRKPIKLAPKDAEAAARVLVRAFHDYPLMAWISPDAEKRQRDLVHGFTRMVRWSIRYGGVLAVSPELEGVLVWVPSGRWHQTWWRNVLSGNYSLPFGLGRKPDPRMEAYQKYAGDVHRRAVSVPHFYLRLLGVDPAHRGKGYSSLLLRSVFEQADLEAKPCWLETQAERNVSIYRHLGFEVVEEGLIPGSGVKSWGMLRMPPP